jgi:hypothetical protein
MSRRFFICSIIRCSLQSAWRSLAYLPSFRRRGRQICIAGTFTLLSLQRTAQVCSTKVYFVHVTTCLLLPYSTSTTRLRHSFLLHFPGLMNVQTSRLSLNLSSTKAARSCATRITTPGGRSQSWLRLLSPHGRSCKTCFMHPCTLRKMKSDKSRWTICLRK